MLLRFSGWDRTPLSARHLFWDFCSLKGASLELKSWLIWVDVSDSSVTTASCFSCLCHSFMLVNRGRWHLPHWVVRTDCVRYWRVPGAWSTQWRLVSSLPCPGSPYHQVLCCPRSLANIRDYEEDEGEKTSGGNGLRDFKREVRRSLYQVNFIHEGILSLEHAPKFGSAGLGPGNKVEALGKFPSLDLWCFYKIQLKPQRKNSISNMYVHCLLQKMIFSAKEQEHWGLSVKRLVLCYY